MSHSSLSAQLASLHTKNTTNNRQQSDAIGRGIHHSVNAGHTVLNASTKHKPSVLHADSRAAAIADVPFTTLRENAMVSLQYLSQRCSPLFEMSGENLPWQTLFGSKSIKHERGLNTRETNAKFDGMVKEALYLLSSAWGDAASTIATSSSTFIQLGANIPSSVLHALEYLVQKYYVHVYNAEILLVTFLPHHETFLFNRVLQLVDLAQLPHWAFLRPFSAAVGVNGVPRTVIAKWAASTKDNGGGTALVKRICDLAKRGAKIHSLERNLMSSDEAREVRRGTSLFISFAAAIMAETLHLQYTTIGSVDESTLRCLVPFVLGAVEPNSKKSKWSLGALCQEWRAFGQIMVSLLVDKCDLSPELGDAFSTGILKGAAESINLFRSETQEGMEDEDEGSSSSMQAILDVSADAILAAMSVVLNCKSEQKEASKSDITCYLPIVRSNRNEVVGCNLPYSAFRALMRLPFLSPTLGYLADEGNVDIQILITSVVAIAISGWKNNRHSANGRDCQKFMLVISEMLEEPSLNKVWEGGETSLTASVAAFIVEQARGMNKDSAPLESFAKLLASLRKMNAAGCDAGVAYAVTKVSSMSQNSEQETTVKSIRELLNTAGLLDADQAIEGMKKKHSKTNPQSRDVSEFDLMLPPRVALEHPNVSLRIDAIEKLTAEAETSEDSEEIATALIRRYLSDDDLSVGSASARALITLSINDSLSELFFLQNSVAHDIVAGLRKWLKATGIDRTPNNEFSPSKDEVDMVCSALELSGTVAKLLKTNLDIEYGDIDEDDSGAVSDAYDQLVHGIVASYQYCENNAGNCISSIRTASEESLQKAVNNGTMPKSKSILLRNTLKSALFQKVLERSLSSLNHNDSDDLPGRNDIVWFFLRQTSFILQDDDIDDILYAVLDASLLVLELYKKETKVTEYFCKDAAILISNLEKCASFLLSSEDISEATRLVAALSTVPSDAAFETICQKVLHKISTNKPNLYPHILLEVISRPKMAAVGVKRILATIDTDTTMINSKKENDFVSHLLICTIALFGNPNLSVRTSALDFIGKVEKSMNEKGTTATVYGCVCSTVCYQESPMRSTVMMDGLNAIPKLLASVASVKRSGSTVRKSLLQACADLVTKHLILDKGRVAGEGICHSVVVLMNAMESAGETSFSLKERWEQAGKPIFDSLLTYSADESLGNSLQALVDVVVVMLKGVTIESEFTEDQVVISTGPTVSGRRRRAYSVGISNGVAYIDPYPAEMSNALTLFMKLAVSKIGNPFMLQLCESMNRLVFGRSSWSHGIFTKLEEPLRKMIVKSLLVLRTDRNVESAGLALLGLPLSAAEFVEAISSKSSRASKPDAGGLLALTVLMSCIRAQADRLGGDKSTMKLSCLLYDKLSSLSKQDIAGDGSDYARTCVIHALLALAKGAIGVPPKTSKTGGSKFTSEISTQSNLIVSLLGEDSSDLRPLVSSRSRSLCLQLLAHLCAISPVSVVESLVPAMINAISMDGGSSNVTREALMVIVPAYCEHAPGIGLSLLSLLTAFINTCNEDDDMTWEKKLQLYVHLNEALMSSKDVEDSGIAMSTVVTMCVASNTSRKNGNNKDKEESSLTFVGELFMQVDPDIQIATTLHILHYIEKLLPCLQKVESKPMEVQSHFYVLEVDDICKLTSNGSSSKSLMCCVRTLLSVVQQVYGTPVVKRVIRKGNDKQAGVCLRIWQELMTLQSASSHIRYEEGSGDKRNTIANDNFWGSVGDEISSILSNLQNLLPAPHFLASVSSLIKDNEVEVDIQRRAILLLAERSAETDATSHEAILFLEMLPDLVKLAGVKLNKAGDSEIFRRSAILSQSSFKTIDQLSKRLGLSLSDDKLLRKRAKAFMPAFQAATTCLHIVSSKWKFPDNGGASEEDLSIFNLETQVLSSAALCSASLITLLNAKCVPMLPKLINSLITFLVTANIHQTCERASDDAINHSVKLIQLSTLRALVAVAECIPQFLTPYIGGILATNGLPSVCLRNAENDEDVAVYNMADRLDRSIASGAPARQLIPILSKAAAKCLKSQAGKEPIWQESLVIFKLLKLSIEKGTRSDLGPMAGKIISALVQAYAFDCSKVIGCNLIDVANDTLMAMVMKLSEAQLRPLYGKLREWRGDLDTSKVDVASIRRRNAFWSLSAAMSKELRSIFLPCMSSVINDIVKELEFAVSCLCVTSKSLRGNKRQKLAETRTNVSQSTSSLQSLLLCLESALKADAHEGGNWIRGDGGQRYTMILQPLSKLISADVPQDSDILPRLGESSESISAYRRLIEGATTEDHGNVVSCLASLAAAAGNEQMWKPLNHSLLEACGNERSEVRKSGVTALLSIIHTLGEEYMILLPECLPVLSELLEDEDEDIVALAKECVQQGEELLGESLEDSLR